MTGVCSTAKVDAVRALGADHVIDYTTTEIDDPSTGGPYDLILDIGGNRPLRLLRKVLAPKGTLVIVGGENGGRLLGGLHRQFGASALSPFVGQRLTFFLSKEHSESLDQLRDLADRGALRPRIDRVYPLAEAAGAMAYFASGRAAGKVVVTP